MKKTILQSIVASIIVVLAITGFVQAKQLWEYSHLERANMALEGGIIADLGDYKYTDNLDQNLAILDVLQNQGELYLPASKMDMLGSAVQPLAGTTYNLAGSGVSSSGVSINIQSLTLPQSGYLIQDKDLSDIFYITLEPGNRTRQEIASCTILTQNANGSATVSGCVRGLLPIPPYTASSTMAFSHAGGSQVIFSNPPQLYNQFTAKGNTETITGPWTFDVYPIASTTLGFATGSQQLITLLQANSIGNQGAATSTEDNAGISELATQAEMASSTNKGVNAPIVLQAKYASSTLTVTTGPKYYIVVTETDGKIWQGYIDVTEAYAWTGAHSFSDTITISGATSLASTTQASVPGGLSPVGSITAYATTTPPSGWLLADGTSYTTAAYPDLYAIIGYTYGGSGANFNVPDLSGRTIVMSSSTLGIVDTLGETGGVPTTTLTTDELPAHTHEVTKYTSGAGELIDGGKSDTAVGVNTGSTGSGLPFTNMQPYFVMQYIIKH